MYTFTYLLFLSSDFYFSSASIRFIFFYYFLKIYKFHVQLKLWGQGTVTLFNFYPMMNVTHRARHHRHIYGMVVRGPHFHNLREKKKKKKKKKKN